MKWFKILVLVCAFVPCIAQDQLFKKDNTKLEVKILEINPTEIKYKLFTYQDGPIITILKKEVVLIMYQNGTHEVINSPAEQPQPVIIYQDRMSDINRVLKDSSKLIRWKTVTATKNLVSLNFLEMFNSCIGINYVREFPKSQIQLYVPLIFGFEKPYLNQPSTGIYTSYNNYRNISDFTYTKKVIESGIGIHINTSGKRAITHFIGPYFGMAQYNGTFNEYFYDNNYYNQSSNVTKIEHGFVMNRYYAMIDNGLLFRITPNFNIMMMASIGFHNDDFVKNNPNRFSTNNYYTGYVGFPFINAFKAGFSMGYRF